jgi:hypothetical protein
VKFEMMSAMLAGATRFDNAYVSVAASGAANRLANLPRGADGVAPQCAIKQAAHCWAEEPGVAPPVSF